MTAGALTVPAGAAAPKVVTTGDNYFEPDAHVHGVGATRRTVVRWVSTVHGRGTSR